MTTKSPRKYIYELTHTKTWQLTQIFVQGIRDKHIKKSIKHNIYNLCDYSHVFFLRTLCNENVFVFVRFSKSYNDAYWGNIKLKANGVCKVLLNIISNNLYLLFLSILSMYIGYKLWQYKRESEMSLLNKAVSCPRKWCRARPFSQCV